MEDINQQSSKKRHINYNWSLENWVWFECRCLTRETRFSWRPGSNTSKGKEKKKKTALSNLCSYIFWCSWACKQWGNNAKHTAKLALWFSAACPNYTSEKMKGRQISAQASPEPAYDSLISQKPRATHLKKTSGGRQTSSSSRMDRQGPRKRQAEGP